MVGLLERSGSGYSGSGYSLLASLRLLGVDRRALGLLACRPALWPSALGLAVTMSRPGWWRQWPPRPLPSRRYLGFRAQTLFGVGPGVLEADTLVEYVKWWQRMRRLAR